MLTKKGERILESLVENIPKLKPEQLDKVNSFGEAVAYLAQKNTEATPKKTASSG